MKIKDRIILKSMFTPIIVSSLVALSISYIIIPLIFSLVTDSFTISAFPSFTAPVLLTSVLFVVYICIGALSIQDIRAYLLFGYTRRKAFLRAILTSAVAILFGLIIVLVIVLINSEYLVFFKDSSLLYLVLWYLSYFLFSYAIGLLCSSLSTTCKPPLSVLVCAVVLSIFLSLQDWLSEMGDTTDYILGSNNVVFTFSSGEITGPFEIAMTALISLLMVAVAYIVYSLKISNIKSTSLN